MDTKKVVIVEDQSLFANGLKNMLEQDCNIQIEAIITNGNLVKRKLGTIHADILLLDLNIPGKNGFEVLEEVRSIYPNLIIAILSAYDSNDLIEKAKKLGANGYLSKNASLNDLKNVFWNCQKDDFYISEQIYKKSKSLKRVKTSYFAEITKLTHREKQILKLLCEGKNSKQISKMLNISQHTVRTHRKNMLSKFDFHKTTELITYAIENRII